VGFNPTRVAPCTFASVEVKFRGLARLVNSRYSRDMRSTSILVTALVLACAAAPDRRANELTHRSLIIDAHSDITEQIVDSKYDFAKRHTAAESMEDLPRLQEGGLDAQIFAIWINHDRIPPERFFAEAEHELLVARETLGRIPGMALATTARQVRENKAHGVTSALFGVEGGYMLTPGDELEHLRRFASLGARYLTLTHTKRGSIGGSSGDMSDGEGLTDQGKLLLDELWRLGVVADVSHVSDPLFWDVVRWRRSRCWPRTAHRERWPTCRAT
jgi:membrane dipeptidase